MSVLSTIESFFPPPRYISFPSIGIDISDTSLKYVEFERVHTRDTELALRSWGDISVPEGIVERGSVHDVEKLTAALREVKKQTRAEYACISLPEERAYLFETAIPRTTARKNIREMLEFKLEENVPLSPRDAYFDYGVVGLDPNTNDTRVAVAVYARETINNYYEACTNAGFIPLAFEIEAQAIARAAVNAHLRGTYLIVDFGKTRMGVGIVHKGVLMYTSTIDISGRAMSGTMREVLGNRSETELTEIKNTKGLLKTKENEIIAGVLEKFAASVVDELGIRIHYWHTRDIDRKEREIQKIVLCGGSANLFGLPEYVADKLNIPTERAQVWQNAFSLEQFVPPITRPYSYGYATAIGLALRGFTKDI